MTVEPEELNEEALFEQAMDDAPAEIPVAEPVAEPEPKAEPEAELKAEAEKPAVDDNAPLVPSWRLREINEEKRRFAEENDRMKAELASLRQTQPKQEQPKAEKAARPDPLLDPDGYAAAIRQELRDEALNDRREESLQRAAEANPADFKEAYTAAQQAVDPALRARMQASRDPGKTLLEWHREQKTRQEIGGDLTAYKQRLRDEALKDPEFRKAAMEAWRGEASTQTKDGRPRIDLSPSLNGASRSNAALRSSNDDVSDSELFSQTTG